MNNAITEFRGEYAFLSNFYECPINYDGHQFRNAEAAFQAAKCPARAAEFCNLDPSAAKRMGRRVELRPDWEEVKDFEMECVVFAKFMDNPELARKLILTGDRELIEGNTWGDRIWGVCNGVGENRLGKILMRCRDWLRKKPRGCRECPLFASCDAEYRGSRCASDRAKIGLGDPLTDADRIRQMIDSMADEELETALGSLLEKKEN